MTLRRRTLRRLPETIELVTFIVVADEGSLSQAGRRLNVSAPAVAKRLDKLEAVVGERLLLRGARGATLTWAGRRLYRTALRIVDDAEGLLDRSSTHEASSTVELLVGEAASGAATLVGDLESLIGTILATVSDGVALVRVSDDTVIGVNDAMSSILGRSRIDLLSKPGVVRELRALSTSESDVDLGADRVRIVCVSADTRAQPAVGTT
jgi:DNA-binding transcriptional LysR family regulator